MCYLIKTIAGIVLLASMGVSQAASLAELASDALSSDATYKSAKAAWRAGIEKAPQGRAALLPQIGIQQLAYRNGISIPGQPIARYSTNGFTLTLSQSLFNWAGWENWQQGQLLATDADLAFAQAKQDLLLRVSEAYLNALDAQQELALGVRHREAVAAQLALAQRRFALGDATVVDTNEAQAGFDAAQADEIAAQTQLDIAYAALQKIVGHPVDSVSAWRDDVPLPAVEPADLQPWTDAASTAAYDVRRKLIATRLASRESGKARAGDYPTVALVSNVNNGNAAFINGQTNFYTGAKRGTAGYVGIQVSLPLTDGLTTRSKIREAAAMEDKARDELDDAQRAAVLAAHDAYLGVTRGLARTGSLATAVRSANVALQSNQTGYRLGIRVNADVLDATDRLYRAQRDLARARTETLEQALKLKASTASLTEGDLAAVDLLLVHTAPATPSRAGSEAFN
jgi:outer membrane protein